MKKRDERKRKNHSVLIDDELWTKLKIVSIRMEITPSEYIEKRLEKDIKEGEKLE